MRPLPAPYSDVALLLGRIVLGAVLIAHGVQKLGNGVGGVAQGFGGMGVPLPTGSALVAIVVELGSGLLLLAGAATTVAGLAAVAMMVGAWFFAHLTPAVFVSDGGWELVGVIAAGALLLAASGPGRFSVDHLLASRTVRRPPERVGAHGA
ncbi:DoxX family protein [Pseudonocardia nantongensis]|uniref:DoxX family protein n=1 Tax=Pseudonocardia nantongensis TaxID=1181885 RepID=UPI00397BC602